MAILLSLLFMDVFIFLALAQEHDIPIHDTLTGLVVCLFFQPRSTMPDLFELLKKKKKICGLRFRGLEAANK